MNPRDRLQPVLLDRLTDLDPGSRVESDDARIMNKSQVREAVLRDLSWLLNSVQPLGNSAKGYPLVEESVLNFGVPPVSGQVASSMDLSTLARTIKRTILRFEPRVMEDSLRVKAPRASSVLDAHNVIEFEIRGFMWAQPVPLEMLLRTQLDLEAGTVQVYESSTSASRRRA